MRALLWLAAAAALAGAQEPLLWYDFESVVGGRVADRSGRGLDAQVEGATPVPHAGGTALAFDGIDDRVVVENSPALDLRTAVSVEVWVRPERVPDGEVGLVIKGVDSYGLTYYRDGRCWWYISGGGNHCKSAIAPGFWYHLVGTYDGQEMCLYVNGRLRDRRALAVPIHPGPPLRIGDRGDAPGSLFAGAIDDVRVYDRALSAEEVLARFEAGRAALWEPCPEILPVATLGGPGWRLGVAPGGALQLEHNGDRCLIDSSFSHPGEQRGWHRLTAGDADESWRPVITGGGERLQLSAAGPFYRLERTVAVEGHRIAVTDTLTAKDDEVGLELRHRVILPEAPGRVLLGGAAEAAVSFTAEHPTIYIEQAHSRLAVLAEDTISRLQFEAVAYENQATYALRHLGLAPGGSLTLRWAIYPLGGAEDEFDFVSQVRRDWHSNFTIPGPWSFFDVIGNADLLADPDRLRRWLERNRLKVVALSPWLDYENWDSRQARLVDRDAYRAMMRRARDAFRAVDPEIRCTGCIEGNLVAPPEAVQQALYAALDETDRSAGIRPCNERQMALLADLSLRWRDSLLTLADGRHVFELYYRGPNRTPLLALAVYAAPGNSQEAYWLEQARFIMEDVGLDGIYIDQFSLAFDALQRYSYGRWDGVTVDLDPGTGRIVRRYTDAAYAGVGARRALIDEVLGRGGVMVTNTCPAAAELQALPVPRFMEAEFSFLPLEIADGREPPLALYPAKGQLGGGLGLGCRPGLRTENEKERYAQTITRCLIGYLRHGILFYHYVTDIPEEGPGSGEYGPTNHMFPITPQAIGKGWVDGRERVVTAVSGTWRRGGEAPPRLWRFDDRGREIPVGFAPRREGDGWVIEASLRDWQEVLVIEAPAP